MRYAIGLLETLAAAAIGLIAVRALYLANGWWLNSGSDVLWTTLVLLALGLGAAVWPSGRPGGPGSPGHPGRVGRADPVLLRATAVWAGAMVEMTILLFRTGPGTIWPIVMVFAAAISAAAVFAGACVGGMLTKRRH